MTLDIDPETLKHQDSTPEKALLLNVLSKWKQAEKYKLYFGCFTWMKNPASVRD